MGDFIGSNISTGFISDCFATGAVSGTDFIGGFVGGHYSGQIARSYCIGEATGLAQGFSGYAQPDSTLSSFWDTETSLTISSLAGVGLTTAQMMMKAIFVSEGWDFNNVWTIEDGVPIIHVYRA